MIANILFQDTRFVVLDKPPGLPAHPVRQGGPSLEDCFPHISRRKDGPWLVHRLDRDTSGCLLVALRKAALIAAQAEFAAGRVRKTYWAIVRGGPAQDGGEITAPLRRQAEKTAWRMVVDPLGEPASTAWQVLGRGPGIAWLELRPRSGRTHQLRVHCAALGFPILGDPIYGDGVGMLHLLARELELDLAPPVRAIAAPAAHMQPALLQCGWGGIHVMARDAP